jgi:hypothetical protein
MFNKKVMGLKVWHWIIVIALFGAYLGYWQLPIVSDFLSGQNVTPTPGPSPGEEIYYGACTFKITMTDYFTGSDSTSAATNEAAALYHSKPGIGAAGASVTPGTTGATHEILESDKGYIWMYFYAGDDVYFVDDLFNAANSRVSESEWIDFDSDGTDEFIFKAWVGDVGERGQGLTPVVSFAASTVDEDDGSIADDNPADITGIGETSGTVTAITWKISGCTAEDGYYLARMYVATNDTRGGDDVRMAELTISGGWTIGGQTSWGAPISESNGNYEAWYWAPADYTEPHNAIPMWRGTNAADSLYITLNVKSYFETNDRVQFTIYLDWVQPDGGIDTDSDAVVLDEA